MKDGSEVQGRWYDRREDVTGDQGDRWDGIELEVDDPRADLLEEGQPVSVRFPDATQIRGRAVYVREEMTGANTDGHKTVTPPRDTVPPSGN